MKGSSVYVCFLIILLSCTGIEADADRDYWMTAQEAKDYGMIDNILLPEKK